MIMMRVFVALDIPKEVRDYLFELQKKMNSNFAKVKWVSKKHLHLTLKFLGEVSDKKVEQIVERLSNVKKRSLKVNLSRIGFFEGDGQVRVIWTGIEPGDEVDLLQQDVDGELLDIFSEPQKFSSHITLGRVKSIKNNDGFLEKVKAVKVEHMEFELSHIKLYQSVLKGSTQEYVCIKEF